MHCHTAGIGAGGSGAWISDELRASWKFRLYLRVFGSDEKTVEAEGDEILMDVIVEAIRESVHVDGAVILAVDAPYTREGELDRAVLSDQRLEGRLMDGADYPLVTPWHYPLNLRWRELWQLARTRNLWDRDVKLKAALGVRPEVFVFSRDYLGL